MCAIFNVILYKIWDLIGRGRAATVFIQFARKSEDALRSFQPLTLASDHCRLTGCRRCSRCRQNHFCCWWRRWSFGKQVAVDENLAAAFVQPVSVAWHLLRTGITHRRRRHIGVGGSASRLASSQLVRRSARLGTPAADFGVVVDVVVGGDHVIFGAPPKLVPQRCVSSERIEQAQFDR